jgi:hypothetical protein
MFRCRERSLALNVCVGCSLRNRRMRFFRFSIGLFSQDVFAVSDRKVATSNMVKWKQHLGLW